MTLGSVLIFLAIVLPAFAGALSGIHVQREFHRNAERYGRMAPYLLAIERRIAASDRASIRALAQEVADLMLNENSDWFTVMRFRDFELPV